MTHPTPRHPATLPLASPPARRPTRTLLATTSRALPEMLALAAVWGTSFLFLRIAAPTFGPVPLVGLRMTLAAACLAPILWAGRRVLPMRRWPAILGLGALTAAPYVLFAWAAQQAPAGIVAISNATVVLFTVVLGALLFGERVARVQLAGVLLGLVGVVVLASARLHGAPTGAAVVAGCVASCIVALTSLLLRRHFADIAPPLLAAATLAAAFLWTAPFALANLPTAMPPPGAWLAVLALGVVCTGAAQVVFLRLIARTGPARASTVMYLVPLFAMVWAWLFLDEPVTASMAVAATLILAAVAACNRSGRDTPPVHASDEQRRDTAAPDLSPACVPACATPPSPPTAEPLPRLPPFSTEQTR